VSFLSIDGTVNRDVEWCLNYRFNFERCTSEFNYTDKRRSGLTDFHYIKFAFDISTGLISGDWNCRPGDGHW